MTEKRRIVLAEDNHAMKCILRDYLERHHFEVIVTEDIYTLKERSREADILVVDVMLPEQFAERVSVLRTNVNGIEFVGEALNLNYIRREVPIVFISILAETRSECQEVIEKYHIKGRYVWLQKPFELDDLLDRINSEMKRLKEITDC